MLSRSKLQRWPCIVSFVLFKIQINRINMKHPVMHKLDVQPNHIWKQQLHKAITDTVTGQLR